MKSKLKYSKRAFIILTTTFFLIEANGQNSKVNSLCEFQNRRLGEFVSKPKENLVDTIPVRQYTGHITSFYLRFADSTYFEVFPTIVENRQFSIRSDKSIKNAKIEIVTLGGQTIQTDRWNQGALLQKVTIRNNMGPNSYFVKLTDDKGAVEIRKIFIL